LTSIAILHGIFNFTLDCLNRVETSKLIPKVIFYSLNAVVYGSCFKLLESFDTYFTYRMLFLSSTLSVAYFITGLYDEFITGFYEQQAPSHIVITFLAALCALGLLTITPIVVYNIVRHRTFLKCLTAGEVFYCHKENMLVKFRIDGINDIHWKLKIMPRIRTDMIYLNVVTICSAINLAINFRIHNLFMERFILSAYVEYKNCLVSLVFMYAAYVSIDSLNKIEEHFHVTSLSLMSVEALGGFIGIILLCTIEGFVEKGVDVESFRSGFYNQSTHEIVFGE
jgi:hypothetical protein